MAIQFARCEYISRSTGGNACRKASYNQRETIPCERTGEVFSFKERGGNVHHEILLPEGVDSRLRNSQVLWNEVEKCEKRRNSQLAKEFVLALPDDEVVVLEDRIELTRRFAQIFVEKGVAVQCDVHSPHDGEKNWHAHLLVTTRRFSEDGLTFSAKARDLDPIIRSGVVVEGDLWGEIWKDLQNTYFKEKGYNLRVDPIGIIPQEHLGPVRMRHHMNEALLRAQLLQKANEDIATDPKSILEEITSTKAIFTEKDVEAFIKKHVPSYEKEGLLEKVISSSEVLELYEKDTEKPTKYLTTQKVRDEEEKLLRFADGIAKKPTNALDPLFIAQGLKQKRISAEQRAAYDLCVSSGQNLSIIQGRAGVGKSYVLDAIRRAHEVGTFRVLGLAPTNKVAMDLKESGFKEAKTCHSFLFAFKNNRESLSSNTLVIVDEAGMLGTELSVELFNTIKSSGAKLILVGDDRQLSSVERGGAFRFLAERYGAAEISEVRRQAIGWQKAVSEDLSKGDIKSAVNLLHENKAILWNKKKEDSLHELLKAWGTNSFLNPHETRQILAHRNADVDALNQGARDILRQQGRLGELEVTCTTQIGRVAFAIGDRVQFTKTDKEQGLINGYFGTIEHIDPRTKKLSIRLDNKDLKNIDPNTYEGLRHGYAATIYKSQGSTLDHIYVLHSKFMNKTLHYVALTRQSKSLSFYVSQSETPSITHLIHQMSQEEGKSTSLAFDTKKDLEKRQEEKSLFLHAKQTTEKLITKIKDLLHKNEDFYEIKRPQSKLSEPAVLSSFQPPSEIQEAEKNIADEKKQKKNLSSNIVPFKNKQISQSLDANQVEEALKQNMASFADHILESIGEPYHRNSSATTERRYGKKGHIAVNLRTGAWIDYKDNSLSGGPLHLLTKLKGLSFKEALEYGASWAGLDPEKRDISLITTLQKDKRENLEEEVERSKRIQKAQTLWAKGQPIQGTLAERYLREHRNIKGELPQDLRYLPFFKDKSSGNVYLCFMAAAKSPTGEVTAVQLTFLDPHTASKATLETPKKSFGIIKGSAVTLQETLNPNDKKTNVLFIAEGVETALSVKEAGVKGTIKASLGLSNIRRLLPENPKTHIVICADNDASDSPASQNLTKSTIELKEKGLKVTVIKPEKLNEDFNDVLKVYGSEGVQEILARYLSKEMFTQKTRKAEQKKITASLKDLPEKSSLSEESQQHILQESIPKSKSFEELVHLCEKRLYNVLLQGKEHLTPERAQRFPLQAERTATFLAHSYSLKGVTPPSEVIAQYSLRAKYELKRIAEIRKELIKEWKQDDNFKNSDGLLAHMMAERLVSIEGRLYFEAKQGGFKLPVNIEDLAHKELKQHKIQTKILAQELSHKYCLLDNTSIYCAKNILRYKETHGVNPSNDQIDKMAQIALTLKEKDPFPFAKNLHHSEIDYIQRRIGDLLFKQLSFQDKIITTSKLTHLYTQAKTSLEAITCYIAKDNFYINQKDLSL